MSAVDERSRSLAAGEKCRGGGVSRESSFTNVGCDFLERGGKNKRSAVNEQNMETGVKGYK